MIEHTAKLTEFVEHTPEPFVNSRERTIAAIIVEPPVHPDLVSTKQYLEVVTTKLTLRLW